MSKKAGKVYAVGGCNVRALCAVQRAGSDWHDCTSQLFTSLSYRRTGCASILR